MRRAGSGRVPESLLGSEAAAIAGAAREPVVLAGKQVGSVFEDDHARYCRLSDLRAGDLSAANVDQARAVFESIESGLRLAGFELRDVVRTWFYLRDILDWYTEFNGVRTRLYAERRVFDGLTPASTGVGAPNGASAAVTSDVFAMKPKRPDVSVREVVSPLQCDAGNYGSSFSRAVEVTLGGEKQLFISGTSSIGPGGETAYPGDVENQVALTMKVVHAILESRGMSWPNVTRAVAYFKRTADGGLLDRYCRENGLPPLPAVVATPVDICRADLLFEIEVDAASGFR